MAASPSFGLTEGVVDAMSFSFDLQLFLQAMEEENVHQLQLLEHANKDVLRVSPYCLRVDYLKNFSQMNNC